MKKPPTDREILKFIYETYYDHFECYDVKEKNRSSKIYVPIDCKKVAEYLRADPDIIFGRLYYHLDKKYGYTQDDGSKVHLFAMKAGEQYHTVHFPLLSAVVSEMETSWFRFNAPLIISAAALIVSILGNI